MSRGAYMPDIRKLFENAAAAYELLDQSREQVLQVLLDYRGNT